MIQIRRIEPDEVPAAKRLIYRVAHVVFNDARPLEESMAYGESNGWLKDMNDIQQTYFDNDGIFLVMTDDDQLIGTGAIRKLEDKICELKRLWLLTEYHNKGLGYRMMQELLSFAREKGYERIRLETDAVNQKRAVEFYKRLGFYEIPNATDDEDILMELPL
ncbi:MAG: GNAT family N-acetyltransferase [Anaerolineae bacterium]|nr:GNAT family N-acetyltransferase [Anaerolineae bacterium]MCI0608300.1 GNAT family N-acetyltransferase [Anaerolineae bacterium]